MALTVLHLWPPHTAPMGPGALFKLSSGLWALVWSQLLRCLFAALLWLSLPVAPTLCPCLADCSLCLVLDLLPWAGQHLALVTVTRADPDVTSQLDLVTRDFPAVGAGGGWCCPEPALLSLLRQDKAVPAEVTAQIPLEKPAQLFQTRGSWASLHLALLLHNSFFLRSGEIERVIN